MTPNELKAATMLLEHYRLRQTELAQLHDVGCALSAVTLTFADGNRVAVNLRADLSDTEQMRGDILEDLTRNVQMSVEATRDHLTTIGVEV